MVIYSILLFCGLFKKNLLLCYDLFTFHTRKSTFQNQIHGQSPITPISLCLSLPSARATSVCWTSSPAGCLGRSSIGWRATSRIRGSPLRPCCFLLFSSSLPFSPSSPLLELNLNLSVLFALSPFCGKCKSNIRRRDIMLMATGLQFFKTITLYAGFPRGP